MAYARQVKFAEPRACCAVLPGGGGGGGGRGEDMKLKKSLKISSKDEKGKKN